MVTKKKHRRSMFVGASLIAASAAISAVVAIDESAPSSSSTTAAPSTTPVTSSVTSGGSFSDQASLATPMSEADAISAARQQGTAVGSSTAGSASATAEVVIYSQFLTRIGRSFGNQLAGGQSVILVTVAAPYPAEAITSPAGMSASSWPTYSEAFDPRTGLVLWLGPTPN
jgi:hypothetical protein